MARVVIGEDDTGLRDTLARLLTRAGHNVVGTAGDGPGLVRQARLGDAQLVIADVRMPPSRRDEGMRAARRIREHAPATAVLVLSHELQLRYAAELLAGDARGVGYLLKQRLAEIDRFLATVDTLTAGGTVLDAELAGRYAASAAASAARAEIPSLR